MSAPDFCAEVPGEPIPSPPAAPPFKTKIVRPIVAGEFRVVRVCVRGRGRKVGGQSA
jgi:hypothetical protein